MTDEFLNYLRAGDDPRIARLYGADAESWVSRVREDERADTLLNSWEELFETTRFQGISTDGTIEPHLFRIVDEGAANAPAVAAARELLAVLDGEQVSAVRHGMNSRVWRAWMNPEIYLNKFGVRLEHANDDVREAVFELMRVTLSGHGYDAARRIMAINGYLGKLVGGESVLNEFSYNVNVFGEPDSEAPWGWQIYGHHLVINCVFVGDQVALTPAFFGSEPTALPGDAPEGVLFSRAEGIAVELMGSLDEAARKSALLYRLKRDPAMPANRVVPGDELTLAGAFQDNRQIPLEGLCIGSVPAAQQKLALSLIDEMMAHYPDTARQARVAEASEHMDRTYFCWIGGVEPNEPFYFRVQGPTILVELDHHAGVFLGNEEPARFHTHTVVRVPNGNDYGVAWTTALTGQHRDLAGE